MPVDHDFADTLDALVDSLKGGQQQRMYDAMVAETRRTLPQIVRQAHVPSWPAAQPPAVWDLDALEQEDA